LLPVRYDSHEQLQPGDLIFAEGKYVKEGAKPQKGDIVHVEVFLGGGPASRRVCGARWGKGVVQVPPPRSMCIGDCIA
jgi:cell wall-associated NlpC family hydrolase